MVRPLRPPGFQPDGKCLENTWNWQPVDARARAVSGRVPLALRRKGGDDPVVALLQGELQQQPVCSRGFILGGRLGWGGCIPELPGLAGIHGWLRN